MSAPVMRVASPAAAVPATRDLRIVPRVDMDPSWYGPGLGKWGRGAARVRGLVGTRSSVG